MSLQRIGGIALGALALLAVMTPKAEASLVWSSSVGGSTAGSTYLSFDSLPLGNAGGTVGGVTVSFTGTGQAVQGAVNTVYAAPFLSNNNGVPFGDPSNGADATTYLTSGIDQVSLALPTGQLYFGLLWGSVDNYNTLTFYNGASQVGVLTGTDIWAAANGDQGVNGTFYVNIWSDLTFDRVVATSSVYAFEFDNVAFSDSPNEPVVPEPASLGLVGLGLSTLALMRRRFAKQPRV